MLTAIIDMTNVATGAPEVVGFVVTGETVGDDAAVGSRVVGCSTRGVAVGLALVIGAAVAPRTVGISVVSPIVDGASVGNTAAGSATFHATTLPI